MIYRITSLLLQPAMDLREKHPRENTAAAPAVEQEMGKAQKSPAALGTSFPSWDEQQSSWRGPFATPSLGISAPRESSVATAQIPRKS